MMNELEQQLLREEGRGAEPRLCLRSRARIDAGRWWRKSPVWLCLMPDELILLAVGRRRYVERIAIAGCQASRYHHPTGELVIEPAEDLRFKRFSLPPRDAIRLLKLLETVYKPTLTEPNKC